MNGDKIPKILSKQKSGLVSSLFDFEYEVEEEEDSIFTSQIDTQLTLLYNLTGHNSQINCWAFPFQKDLYVLATGDNNGYIFKSRRIFQFLNSFISHLYLGIFSFGILKLEFKYAS